MPRTRPPSRAGGARAAKPPAKRRVTDLITVDVGNSDTVVGWFHGPTLRGFWRLTSARASADEAWMALDALMRAARGPAGPGAGTVLCSVVPPLTVPWSVALARWSGAPPFEVNAGTARSLPIRYADKTAVGADRIANAIAARAFYGTPAIVVDLGTATTFDCISREGAYLGGAISPGVSTSADELFRRAARLAPVELRPPTRALGRTTEESLRAGVLLGAAGSVDLLVRRLSQEMKGEPVVIATGGWAKVIAPLCETVQHVDEELTLKGMKRLWEESA